MRQNADAAERSRRERVRAVVLVVWMLACLMAALLVGTVDLGSAMEAPLGPEPGLSQ